MEFIRGDIVELVRKSPGYGGVAYDFLRRGKTERLYRVLHTTRGFNQNAICCLCDEGGKRLGNWTYYLSKFDIEPYVQNYSLEDWL